MTLVRDMPEHKRLKIRNTLKDIDERERNILKREELRKIRDIHSRRKIVVYNMHDFIKKYEYYNIDINMISRKVVVREPLEVSYLKKFRYDCAILGLTWEVKVRRPDTSYLRY